MKMSKKSFLVLMAGAVVLAASGCASQKTWVYRTNSFSPGGQTTEKTIAVVAYEDCRENYNNNYLGLYAIPIMPFGWQTLNSPEGITMHTTSGMWLNYKPTEDYPKALAEDLRNTGLFSDAFFDFRKSTSDYAVKGKIISTKYKGTIISYGLSVYGPLLWFVGFPSGTTYNDLSLDLSLVDSKSNKVIFSKTYTATPQSHVCFLYYMPNDFNYPEMLAEINKQFCTDIQPVIVSQTKTQASAVSEKSQPSAN
jgi:curli biogenesis system outer membrane secretion channel CsgG